MSGHSSTSLSRSLAFAANRVTSLARRRFEELLASESITVTPEEWIVLAVLSESGSVNQTELAALLLRDRTTVTRLLDGLIRRGLADRRRSPDDRREIRTTLSDKGASLVGQITPLALRLRGELAEGISAEDLAATFRTLERVKENLIARPER